MPHLQIRLAMMTRKKSLMRRIPSHEIKPFCIDYSRSHMFSRNFFNFSSKKRFYLLSSDYEGSVTRWDMLILLGLFSLCLGQDLALVEVRPTDGSEGSFKFCVGYGQVGLLPKNLFLCFPLQDYGYDKELPTDAAHSDLTFEFDDLTELGSLALCKNYTDNDSIDSSGGAALVKRGNCTFQEKATTWKNRNGNGLITVNTEDSIFPPGVSNSSASDLQMFVAIMANSRYTTLKFLHNSSISSVTTTWKALQKATMVSVAFVGLSMHCQSRANLILLWFVSGSSPWYVLQLAPSSALMAFPKWGQNWNLVFA